jgi:hypothetical protein
MNGSYVFDYSSATGAAVLIDPSDGLLTAEVDWIKGIPLAYPLISPAIVETGADSVPLSLSYP